MSLPESQRSAEMFCKSAAFRCRLGICATGVPPVLGHGRDGRGTFRLRLRRWMSRRAGERALRYVFRSRNKRSNDF